VKRSQVVTYSLGVLAIWLVAGTQIHDLGEQYLLSAHMFEHAVLTLVAAPLLLAGIPSWMWQTLLRLPGMLKLGRVLVHPIVILFVVNMTFVILHLPWFMNEALIHHPVHLMFHIILVATALLMWWPVLSNVPELPRLNYPGQMAYLFLESLIPTVVASFITFADEPVYQFYTRVPRLWMSALTDQQVAGGIMKVMGGLILWWFIGLAFFRWYREHEAAEKGPNWRDVESELEQLGLSSKR
jgi:putative membrane protein